MRELATDIGVDRRTVSTYLRRAGVAVRRGGLDQKRAVEAAQLYEAGWSSGRLAERFDVSADNVLEALRRAGVAIRPRHDAWTERIETETGSEFNYVRIVASASCDILPAAPHGTTDQMSPDHAAVPYVVSSNWVRVRAYGWSAFRWHVGISSGREVDDEAGAA